MLLSPIMSCIILQYYSLYFLITIIGGNIFINCIVMGVGEILAGLISGQLMQRFKDTHVFLWANLFVGIFNTIFYFLPSGGPLLYACLLLTILGCATQFNCIFVLVELRVPPENAGSALVIVTTVGQLTAAVAPMMSHSGFPTSMLCILGIVVLNIFLMCFLSEPGAYLPQEH